MFALALPPVLSARAPVVLGGPAALVEAARSAAGGWPAEPVCLNGAPTPPPHVLAVRFR